MRRAWRALIAVAAVVTSVGCVGLPAAPAASGDAPPFEFRMGPGDQLRIGVWGEKELTHDVQLGPDGRASLPLVGDVALGGMTLDEGRVALAKRYKASLVDPVVSVSLLEARSHVIHVFGEVAAPGTVSFVRGATALGAVLAAGGFKSATADLGAVRIVRQRLGSAPEAFELDLAGVLEGARSDVWLQPGDVVYVPARLLTRWNRWWRQAFPWSDPVEAPR